MPKQLYCGMLITPLLIDIDWFNLTATVVQFVTTENWKIGSAFLEESSIEMFSCNFQSYKV